MLEFALSQETVRAAPLLPPEEGREENNMFHFISEPTFSKKEQFPFSSGFSGPWDDSVQVHASSLSPTTHLTSSQESAVRGRSTSPHTSSQSHLGFRKFGKDSSERTRLLYRSVLLPFATPLQVHQVYIESVCGRYHGPSRCSGRPVPGKAWSHREVNERVPGG